MKPRIARNGCLWFQFVLPTQNLRDIVYRRLRAQYPQLNYCVEWRDTNGFGISMTVTDHIADQGMYHCPHSHRPYVRPDLERKHLALIRDMATRYGRYRAAMVGTNPYPKGRPSYE